MGLFLALSGVIGADQDSVIKSARKYCEGQDGKCEPRLGTTDDPNIAVVAASNGNTILLYPGDFFDWDGASKHLSADLQVPVFSFHIHDGDLWMFVAYDQGIETAWFNPIPDYWGDVDLSERKRWAGDAAAVTRLIPNVAPASIAKYFLEWNEDTDGKRAYPDDENPYGTDWQMTDFMRRIGLNYPIGSDGTIRGETYFFEVRPERSEMPSTSSSPSNPKLPATKASFGDKQAKPWWKFW
jgi:hypothetical protein